MRLRDTNHIELSVANLKALLATLEECGDDEQTIYKRLDDGTVACVTVVSDEVHYGADGVERRKSPYLPPEVTGAWRF